MSWYRECVIKLIRSKSSADSLLYLNMMKPHTLCASPFATRERSHHVHIPLLFLQSAVIDGLIDGERIGHSFCPTTVGSIVKISVV